MPQAAYGTVLPVRLQYSFTKGLLVKPDLHSGGHISSANIVCDFSNGDVGCSADVPIIDRYCKRKRSGIVVNNVGGVHREIEFRDNTVEIDERDLPTHRGSEADVVRMVRVRPTVLCSAVDLPH